MKRLCGQDPHYRRSRSAFSSYRSVEGTRFGIVSDHAENDQNDPESRKNPRPPLEHFPACSIPLPPRLHGQHRLTWEEDRNNSTAWGVDLGAGDIYPHTCCTPLASFEEAKQMSFIYAA